MSCQCPDRRAMTSPPAQWLTSIIVGVLALLCEAPSSAQQLSHRDLTQFETADGTLAPIQSADDWQKRRESILKGMQRAMGPLPSFTDLPPFDPQLTEDTRIGAVRRMTMTIQVEPGDSQNPAHRLPLDLYLPGTIPPVADVAALMSLPEDLPLPAILALHPTGASGKRIVAGEGPKTNRQYGLELAQRGYIVICPDYPSFGQYDYDFAADKYVSGTMKGIFNHMRCVDFLAALPCVDPSRVGAIGHSLGGHNAMFTAVFDPRIKVTVSSCGWTPFHDYYQGKIAGWTSDRYMPLLKTDFELDPDRVPFDFYEVVAAMAPRTFLSISPLHDSNFDVKGVQKAIPPASQIYKLLNAPDALILVTPDCEHDFPADMRQRAYAEIDHVLKHKPDSPPEPDYSGELPRITAHEPADALKTFATARGFALQQTAADSLVCDPVAMAFDADGRLFVVEMRDYSEQAEERLGRVRLLLDKNNDGVWDESHVFAEGLSWPTAVTCYDGGIFVGAAPDIHYFKDTNGDHKADQHEVVFTGFGRSNVQGLMNCLHWGPDNRIYGQTSSSGALITTVAHPDRPAVDLRQRDFSFDPKTRDFRPESGGAQHGMCFDDWGNRFVCSNSDHAQVIVYNDRYLTRSPQVAAAPPRVSVAVDGGQAPVFRTSPVEPWRIVRTRLRASGVVKGIVEGGGRPAGYFTGSTGINVYRGDAWDPELKGLLVMADVGSNIVHRKKAIPDGVVWKAERIDDQSEFVSSTDIWFRPVQMANAPDGCLHVLDMYREVIEHPASLPPEIKQHLDLTSGRDRGRLYRIAAEGKPLRKFVPLSNLKTTELVKALQHSNGWHRDTASRLLFERQDPVAIEPLRNLAQLSQLPQGRIHALNALDGLKSLESADVALALLDEHPRVREHAVRLSERFVKLPVMAASLANMGDEPDLRVRLQLAFTAGEFPDSLRRPLLTKVLMDVLKRDAGDRWIRTAVFTSLQNECLPVFRTLLTDSQFTASPPGRLALAELAELIVRQSPAESIDSMAEAIAAATTDQALKLDLIRRVFRGYPAARQNEPFRQLTASLIAEARASLDSVDQPLARRTAAAGVLTLSTYADENQRLFGLLTSATPPELQVAAVDALGSFSEIAIAQQLVERLPDFSPKVAERSRELLLNRGEWTSEMLVAVSDGRLPGNTLSSAELQRLAGHPDAGIRERATALMANVQSTPRDEVIRQYQPALGRIGDTERGAALFKQHCSVCHQLNGVGHAVGPNLATITNRGAESLLVNLLDPNREVNPAWRDYIAVTNAGTTHNGVIISESSTSITLRRAEAKEDSLLRADLETIRDTGRSLMPEGLEKQIDVQGMSDLITWLMAQK